jgi:hypothetical protein
MARISSFKENTDEIVEYFFWNLGKLSIFYSFNVILTNISPILKGLNVIYELWPIIIPDIKIIQRISTIIQRFHFNFWKPIQFLTILFVLLHFNQNEGISW